MLYEDFLPAGFLIFNVPKWEREYAMQTTRTPSAASCATTGTEAFRAARVIGTIQEVFFIIEPSSPPTLLPGATPSRQSPCELTPQRRRHPYPTHRPCSRRAGGAHRRGSIARADT